MTIIRMDRRPSISPVPFHDVYIVEVERNSENSKSIDGSQEGGSSWMLEVEEGLQRIRILGGVATLLGVW